MRTVQAKTIIQQLFWLGVAMLGSFSGAWLSYPLGRTSAPLAAVLCLMVVAGTLHAAGRLPWVDGFAAVVRVLSRYAPPPTPEEAANLPGEKRARAEALRRQREVAAAQERFEREAREREEKAAREEEARRKRQEEATRRQQAEDEKKRAEREAQQQSEGRHAGHMSRKEAMDFLGLIEPFTPDDLKRIHKAILQRNHPDVGGSTYITQLANIARDTLLKR